MALVLKDRVRETSNTSGQATLVLNGAVPNYQPFSVIGNGNTTYYTIVNDSQWEVGIGTYTLSGTTLSRDTVLASSNSNNKVDFNSGAKDVFLTYPAEKALSYDGSDNVGIGTTQPASKVQIVGTSTGYATPQLRIGETGSNLSIAKQLLVGYNTTNNYGFVQANQWNTSTTNLSLQPLGGNVGIGTSSPTVKLTIGGSTALAIQASLTSGTSDNANFHLYAVNGATGAAGTEVARFGVGYGGDASTSFSSGFSFIRGAGVTDGSLAILTNASERMRIDSSGNVGIGTALPTQLLTLAAPADGGISLGDRVYTGVKYIGTTGAGSFGGNSTYIGFQGTSPNVAGNIIYNAHAGTHTFRSATTNMHIDAAGNVGIGTTSPTAYLHIKAGTATANTAPLKFNSGTNLTTAEAGAIEYDGKVVYATGEASQRGVIQAPQFITLTAPYTTAIGTANTLKQLFDSSTNGAITVAGNTTYLFECMFNLSSMSATSGTFAFGFGGTATYSLVMYTALANKTALTVQAAANITVGTAATATTLTTANTTTTGYASITGKLVIGTGGTIVPSFALSIAAAAVVNSGSYFVLTPIGSNTVQKIGNWS